MTCTDLQYLTTINRLNRGVFPVPQSSDINVQWVIIYHDNETSSYQQLKTLVVGFRLLVPEKYLCTIWGMFSDEMQCCFMSITVQSSLALVRATFSVLPSWVKALGSRRLAFQSFPPLLESTRWRLLASEQTRSCCRASSAKKR